MSVWHFIIPFYFGENKFVLVKGGAPVSRKLEYLRRTIDSITQLGIGSSITVFVCDEPSQERALKIHPTVQRIDCQANHLPLEAVRTFQRWFASSGTDGDIVGFNEDDQIVHMADPVKLDIQHALERVVFSPHRWSKQFLLFRRKGRPVYYLNGQRGLLDNVDTKPNGAEFHLNHRYRVQRTCHAAYAACWFMRGSVFRNLNFDVPSKDIELESPSYAVFDSGIPVLKLAINHNQQLSDFIVNHLSGYDYNKRLLK
jgi:hypothetical protein